MNLIRTGIRTLEAQIDEKNNIEARQNVTSFYKKFSRKFRKIVSLFFFIEYIYKFIKNNTAFFLGVLFILKGLNVSTEYRTMFVKKLSYVQRKLLYNRHNCLTCSF